MDHGEYGREAEIEEQGVRVLGVGVIATQRRRIRRKKN